MVLAVILPEQRILGFNPLEETIFALAKQHPSSKWIIFSKAQHSSIQLQLPNISRESLPRNWNNLLVKSYWYTSTLSKLIKAYGITDFWSTEAYRLKKSLVSTAVLADEYFLNDKMLSLRRSMNKYDTPLVFSEAAFPEMIKQKFGNMSSYIILPQALPDTSPARDSTEYDVPYFLCHTKEASKLEVLQLLKAFSFFKRRMSSSTKLILLTEGIDQALLVDNFQNYKFREDVHFEPIPDKEKIFNLLHNCIAWISLTKSSIPFFSIHLAAQASKPVIASADEHKAQIFGESLAYFDSQETLAAQMINMYKDENLRSFYSELSFNLTHQKIIDFQDLPLAKLLAVKEL